MRRAPEKVEIEVADTSFLQMKHLDMFWRENHPAAVVDSSIGAIHTRQQALISISVTLADTFKPARTHTRTHAHTLARTPCFHSLQPGCFVLLFACLFLCVACLIFVNLFACV